MTQSPENWKKEYQERFGFLKSIIEKRCIPGDKGVNFGNEIESFISSLLTNQKRGILEEMFRRIEFCGFGAMEWRLKLIDKLKEPATIVKALDTNKGANS